MRYVPLYPKGLKYWSVFPKNEGEVSQYGNFKIMWVYEEIREGPWKSNTKSNTFPQNKVSFFDEKTQRWGPWMDYMEAFRDIKKRKEFLSEVEKEKEKQKKLHQKQKEKERKEKLKKEAEEFGISVQELKERKKAKNQKKARKKDIERTERIMQVAPAIKELREEADRLHNKIVEGEHVKIVRPDLYKRRIEEATRILRTWQQLQD